MADAVNVFLGRYHVEDIELVGTGGMVFFNLARQRELHEHAVELAAPAEFCDLFFQIVGGNVFRKEFELGLHLQFGAGFDLLLDVAFGSGIVSDLHYTEVGDDLVPRDELRNLRAEARVDFIGDGLAEHENGG